MSGDIIRAVQITDCHLVDDGVEHERAIDTWATLAAVIDRVRRESPAPDLVLATGDLSQDGTVGSYRRVRSLFERLEAPIYCLPGNHDVPATLADTVAGGHVRVERGLVRDRWQIVFLDSTVAGEDDGNLSAGELAALDAALAAHPDRHALVCFHHQPVPVGGAWRDVVSLGNAEALFDVVDRHGQVRGLLWGHIHQPFDGERHGVRLMATPATCFQFAEVADGGIAIGDDPPGYRTIELHPDGGIASEVRWLDGTKPTDY